MQPFALDINQIQEYQRNRHPYLFIDRVTEVVPGKYAKGYKNLSMNEWFFPPHFEGAPIMPGAIMLESITQMFIMTFLTLDEYKGQFTNFVSADGVKFTRHVVPGDRLDIEAELKSFRRGIAKGTTAGYVNGEPACRADLVITLPDVIKNWIPPRD